MDTQSQLDAARRDIQAGKLADAAATCRAILRLDPSHSDASHLLGAIALQGGDFDDAIEHCGRAVAGDPSMAKAHSNLGAALTAKGRTDEAMAALTTAIELDPGLASAHVNLGNLLIRLERFGEALAALDKAIALHPDNFMAHLNGGVALLRGHALDEAIGVFARLVEQNPKLSQTHYNLGCALQEGGRHEDALKALLRARDLQPGSADIEINLGAVYRALGRYDEAISAYSAALILNPSLTEVAFFRSLVRLALGRFDDGWRDYLNRSSVRTLDFPLARDRFAEDLAGAEIYLHKDQGLGDEIFFLRFAPELKRRGARITYRAGDKIAPLLRRLLALDAVVEEPPPAHIKSVVSIGDLPYVLGMHTVADIPPSLELAPLQDRLSARRSAIAKLGPPPYVGITWRAGTEDRQRVLFKSIPIESLGGVLKQTNATLFALQRAPQAGEIERLSDAAGRVVHDASALNDDLEDMLALLALLDDYVTVSNTNVHLRAMTGRTSRVLVPNPPEFRWMAEGDESPWFPGCRVYRQGSDGSWDLALRRLARDFAA